MAMEDDFLEGNLKTMEPALSVAGLMNNLDVDESASQIADSMYVHALYQKHIEKLRFHLLESLRKNQTFFVAGQSGTGKSTALRFLPNKDIHDKFKVIYVKPGVAAELDAIDGKEVNIINVMVNIAETLVKVAKGLDLEHRNKKGERYILECGGHFVQYVKQLRGHLTIEEVRADGNLVESAAKISVEAILKYFTSLERERTSRKEVREVFAARIEDLQSELQKLIAEFENRLTGGKPVLLIIDDWEKLKNPDSIEKVFGLGISVLKQLNCSKVMAIPIKTAANESVAQEFLGTQVFFLKIKENPHPHQNVYPEDAFESIRQTRDALKEVVLSRIDEHLRDDMFDQQALEKAIDYSGGILRQYLFIAKSAAAEAGQSSSSRIRLEHVNRAARMVGDSMVLAVSMNPADKRALEYIYAHRLPSSELDPKLFQKLIINVYVIYNRNGLPCYHPNPLLEEMLGSPESN